MKHLYPKLLFNFRQYQLSCITFVLLFGGPRIAKFEYPNLRPFFIFSFLNPTQETFVIHSVKSFFVRTKQDVKAYSMKLK